MFPLKDEIIPSVKCLAKIDWPRPRLVVEREARNGGRGSLSLLAGRGKDSEGG